MNELHQEVSPVSEAGALLLHAGRVVESEGDGTDAVARSFISTSLLGVGCALLELDTSTQDDLLDVDLSQFTVNQAMVRVREILCSVDMPVAQLPQFGPLLVEVAALSKEMNVGS